MSKELPFSIWLGVAPAKEKAVEIDTNNLAYIHYMRAQCCVFLEFLERRFWPTLERSCGGMEFQIKECSTGPIEYCEVVLAFRDNPQIEKEVRVIQRSIPDRWDELARQELKHKFDLLDAHQKPNIRKPAISDELKRSLTEAMKGSEWFWFDLLHLLCDMADEDEEFELQEVFAGSLFVEFEDDSRYRSTQVSVEG